MFTGIVTDVGRVRSIERRGDTRIEIATAYPMDEVAIGASICCGGACMTVVEKGAGDGRAGNGGGWFAVDVSGESLSRTSLGTWTVGTEINLERSLRMGDEMGGHVVTGHVDGLAVLETIEPVGDSHRIQVLAPEGLEGLVAEKGSVALDGVSLTVNGVQDRRFWINLIPHTWAHTTFRNRRPGDVLNMEVDPLARYVARLLSTSAAAGGR
ncbi:riboflavin synthase subunit alpha [Thalassobaculum fulvum]|uniref:Riboflavin synthase n=1 Tax=Thalassobaculum fulvum TaxID=1633335 RepID=A0A918XQQ6_9PROT|nr:riboflavin synthase [Thalassobaculum fulvum]GHD47637.1 riboflavin synthase subunit alpha [Thalassobaculum fulvum]